MKSCLSCLDVVFGRKQTQCLLGVVGFETLSDFFSGHEATIVFSKKLITTLANMVAQWLAVGLDPGLGAFIYMEFACSIIEF